MSRKTRTRALKRLAAKPGMTYRNMCDGVACDIPYKKRPKFPRFRAAHAAQGKPVKVVRLDLVVRKRGHDVLGRDRIREHILRERKNKERMPAAFKWQGTFWLDNGHHRVQAYLLKGYSKMRMRVVDLESWEN